MTPVQRLLGGLAAAVCVAGAWLVATAPERAPEVTFKTIDGRRLDLGHYQGRPVLVTFWATTCPVCVEEIPELAALYREASGRGLEIIAVAMSYDPPSRVLRLAREFPIPYPVALDLDGRVAAAFGEVSATPTSFLVGPDGFILGEQVGAVDLEALRSQLDELLPPA